MPQQAVACGIETKSLGGHKKACKKYKWNDKWITDTTDPDKNGPLQQKTVFQAPATTENNVLSGNQSLMPNPLPHKEHQVCSSLQIHCYHLNPLCHSRNILGQIQPQTVICSSSASFPVASTRPISTLWTQHKVFSSQQEHLHHQNINPYRHDYPS